MKTIKNVPEDVVKKLTEGKCFFTVTIGASIGGIKAQATGYGVSTSEIEPDASVLAVTLIDPIIELVPNVFTEFLKEFHNQAIQNQEVLQ